MSTQPPPTRGTVRSWIVKLHRWLGVGSAIFWLILAITGVLLSFRFEIEDVLISSDHRPTDFAALETRIDQLNSSGQTAKVNWIWTTAGLADRYIIDFRDSNGVHRKIRVDGEGNVLLDHAAKDRGFLGVMLGIHVNFLAGKPGHWLVAITGVFLLANLISGIIVAWPGRGRWGFVLKPINKGSGVARLYSWHRALGLWAVLPAIVIVATGTMIMFEGEIRWLVNAPQITLPVNPPQGPAIGFAAAARATVDAIPGSRFVGTTLPSSQDASYHSWVRAPGSLYRGGYGGSLVVVDANDASIRGAYPLPDADMGYAIIGSLYPLHTGEAGGLTGRLLTFAIGWWLAITIVLGFLLWWRRRDGKKVTKGRLG